MLHELLLTARQKTKKRNALIACSCHFTYAFQSESKLYSCPSVKELFAQSRREIWRLSACNWTQTQNHLVRKRIPNHLANLAKWLTSVLSTYLWCTLDCMFLSCHVRVLGWIQKRVRDMTRTYNQMHRTDKYSQYSSIIWPGWPNGWVFVY